MISVLAAAVLLLQQPTVPDIICQYDWPCDEALGVVYGNARCPNGESTGNPLAYNAGHYGLFQLAAMHATTYGFSVADLWQPETNVYIAHQLWLERGWQPWTCRP